MNTACTLCGHHLGHAFDRLCPHCGASQEALPNDEQKRRLLESSLKAGLREAERRSAACGTAACPHGCPTTSLVLVVPGGIQYRSTLRRCAYDWFTAEYPPEGGVLHDVFHYPV